MLQLCYEIAHPRSFLPRSVPPMTSPLKKAALGLTLGAAGLAATGAAFVAAGGEPASAEEATQIAEARADLLPHASRHQWAQDVKAYTETVAAHHYALALY